MSSSSGLLRYEIFVTVWGKEFVKKFITFSLASQLFPGNLPYLSKQSQVTYRIYTSYASSIHFLPAITELNDKVNLEFVYFENIEYQGGSIAEAIQNSDPKVVKHNVQRLTSQHHLNLVSQNSNSAAILLDSDFIFSEGSFSDIHHKRLAGKTAYAATFLRLHEENASAKLLNILPSPLTGRHLVRIGIDHMHPTDTDMFVNAKAKNKYPVEIKWPVFGKGFISHCFFPHPLMLIPNPRALKYFSTMDYELILKSIPQNEDIYLCQSTDDLMLCKMSSQDYLPDVGGATVATIEDLAQFVISNTNIRHRYFFEKSVRYVFDCDEKAFQKVEAKSSLYVEAAYKAVDVILSNVSSLSPDNMLRIKSFLGPIENFLSPQIHSTISKYTSP